MSPEAAPAATVLENTTEVVVAMDFIGAMLV
jgi:hypothetical protein